MEENDSNRSDYNQSVYALILVMERITLMMTYEPLEAVTQDAYTSGCTGYILRDQLAFYHFFSGSIVMLSMLIKSVF